MGVSTDAILALGIPLDGDEPGFEPFGEGDCEDGPAWMAFTGDAEDGVELVSHCSNECTMYFVAIAGTTTTARRGYPKRVAGLPEANGEGKIRAFIEKHNLNPDGEFGWYLMSMWS